MYAKVWETLTYVNENCLDKLLLLSTPLSKFETTLKGLSTPQSQYSPWASWSLSWESIVLQPNFSLCPGMFAFLLPAVFNLHVNLHFIFCLLRNLTCNSWYQEWPEIVDTEMGYWSLTTCQPPDHEDPVTDGGWSSWKKGSSEIVKNFISHQLRLCTNEKKCTSGCTVFTIS